MSNENSSSTALSIITTAMKVPAVKVDRKAFLMEMFPDLSTDKVGILLDKGPIHSGLFTQEEVRKKALQLANKRKLQSSAVSFAAGLPGGAAMAATIPADALQFWGVALRTAQEISYLYGYKDFWNGDVLNEEAVQSEMLLFMGTMLGVGGAASLTRYISQGLMQYCAQNLAKQALTKTVWYPIIKELAKYISIKLTKQSFSAGLAKVIPVLGGVVSGGLTFYAMGSMTERLCDAFDVAVDYTDSEKAEDIEVIKKEMPDVYDVIFTEIPAKE